MTDDLSSNTIQANAPAEAAVLGAMMLSQAFAQDIVSELAVTDFATPAHQTIFSVIEKLLANRLNVDAVAVADRLREHGHLKEIGGAAFLHSLISGAPTTEVAEHCMEIVRHTAILRGVREESTSISTAQGALVETLERAERHHEEMREISGVPTGIPALDRMTSGLQPGNLVVIAARPSAGKTVLALNFARHAAVHAGVPTLVCSLELSRNEIMQRISCAECTVDLQRLRTGLMEEADWSRLTRSLGKVPMHRCTLMTVWHLASQRSAQRRSGRAGAAAARPATRRWRSTQR